MQGMGCKGYQYLFHPTAGQARAFGGVRYVWGCAPALRTEAWFEHHGCVDHAETDRVVSRMKSEQAQLADGSCVPLQHLNADFFAGRAKCPRIRRRHDRQSATCRRGGLRWKEGNRRLARMDAPPGIRVRPTPNRVGGPRRSRKPR